MIFKIFWPKNIRLRYHATCYPNFKSNSYIVNINLVKSFVKSLYIIHTRNSKGRVLRIGTTIKNKYCIKSRVTGFWTTFVFPSGFFRFFTLLGCRLLIDIAIESKYKIFATYGTSREPNRSPKPSWLSILGSLFGVVCLSDSHPYKFMYALFFHTHFLFFLFSFY